MLRSLALFGLGAAVLLAAVTPAGAADAAPTVIYLVRHAETAPSEPGTHDPVLSAAGQSRAEALAHALADASLTSVHSTALHRTRETAGVVAAAQQLEVSTYAVANREAFASWASTLKATPGRHLVVGHSNTTPALVELLGGDALAPIAEWEHDRLYVVTLAEGCAASSSLLRYGAQSMAPGAPATTPTSPGAATQPAPPDSRADAPRRGRRHGRSRLARDPAQGGR